MNKFDYVKKESRRRHSGHLCHWPGCTTEVPPAMWGCRKHWFTLPKDLRDAIWLAYRPGQEITKTPSKAYLEAAAAVERWIAKHYPDLDAMTKAAKL